MAAASAGTFQASGFKGTVIIPEDRDGATFEQRRNFVYADQVDWERKALKLATVVLFWVPRNLEDMPAFTTNIEFGFVSERNQPYVLGFPKDACKMRYLEWVATEQGAPVTHTLEDTVAQAILMAAPRTKPTITKSKSTV